MRQNTSVFRKGLTCYGIYNVFVITHKPHLAICSLIESPKRDRTRLIDKKPIQTTFLVYLSTDTSVTKLHVDGR